MTQDTKNEVKIPRTPKGKVVIARLRKVALNRLGVGPRDRAGLEKVIELGVGAFNIDGTTQVAQTASVSTGSTSSDSLEVRVSGEHFKFSNLLSVLSAGLHAYLVGPAGSGKTTAAEHCSNKLGLDFYCQSVGAQTTQAQLLGYMDANGRYVSTVFRKAFEFGGVFLLDEIDAGNANVLTVLNAALANGVCSFPDGMVNRHENFRCIAAANTFGNGADRQYVGRNQLDAASIDRFGFIDWPYDEELELRLSSDEAWTKFVQRVRAAVAALKVRHVVSPRASINGSKMLAQGASRSFVEDTVLWKGLDEATKAKVQAMVF